MYRKYLFMSLCLVFCNLSSCPQAVLSTVGAAAAGRASCSVAENDIWGAFNNQAAMAYCQGLDFGVAFENRYLMRETGRIRMCAALKAGRGGLFAGIDHFGDELYSEMKAGLGYALKLGSHFAAGLQLDYLRIAIGEGYGSRNAFTLEGGMMVFPGKKVVLGLYCFNPVHAEWIGESEKLPVHIRAGSSYSPDKSVTICAEIRKSTSLQAIISIGCEYRYRDRISFRAGISSGSASISFGAGYILRKMNIDISSSWHSYLGFSPQISFTYSAKK